MYKKILVIGIIAVVTSLLVVLMAASIAVADSKGGVPRATTLSGAEEVDPDTGELGAGDPDGRGFASIFLNYGQGTVCWKISYKNIAAPTAAHIHAAPAGSNGPIVVPLSPIAEGCTTADRTLIKAIIQDPELYYVNVHNGDFPGGAIRGQLSNRGQSK